MRQAELKYHDQSFQDRLGRLNVDQEQAAPPPKTRSKTQGRSSVRRTPSSGRAGVAKFS